MGTGKWPKKKRFTNIRKESYNHKLQANEQTSRRFPTSASEQWEDKDGQTKSAYRKHFPGCAQIILGRSPDR